MSYILDALRRADAERQRGQTPALQQVIGDPPAPARGEPASPWRRLVPWLLAAGVGAAVLAAWLHSRPPVTAPLPAPAAAEKAPEAAPAPLPPTLPASPVMPLPAPPARAMPRSPAVAAASTPASAALPRTIHASALSEPQRAAIKALGIGGAVHSPERGQSFVLVGGQIMREGATLAPGITLERISPHLLLLRLGGQQVEWPL